MKNLIFILLLFASSANAADFAASCHASIAQLPNSPTNSAPIARASQMCDCMNQGLNPQDKDLLGAMMTFGASHPSKQQSDAMNAQLNQPARQAQLQQIAIRLRAIQASCHAPGEHVPAPQPGSITPPLPVDPPRFSGRAAIH
jgi:hypothetical protein